MRVFRAHIHREKRKYLRTALKELAIVFTDQPGLLGPKVLTAASVAAAVDDIVKVITHTITGVGN